MSILEKWCKSRNTKLVAISDIGFTYETADKKTCFMLFKDFVDEILYDNNY